MIQENANFVEKLWKNRFIYSGVLWLGKIPIKKSLETLKKLQSLGKRIIFASNNSTLTLQDYCRKFQQLSFPVKSVSYKTSFYGPSSRNILLIRNFISYGTGTNRHSVASYLLVLEGTKVWWKSVRCGHHRVSSSFEGRRNLCRRSLCQYNTIMLMIPKTTDDFIGFGDERTKNLPISSNNYL